jgi:hypothetical protein
MFVNSTTPLDLAVGAIRVAVATLQTRQETSAADGMVLQIEEQQTVTGRVVGVTMRLGTLENDLERCCDTTGWVAKYNEWDRFGVSPPAAAIAAATGGGDDDNYRRNTETATKLASDGLFRLNRAECLLALFLHRVEQPELAKKSVSVPDNSTIDFLDADRLEALNIRIL